jgi:pyrroloquinoline-quinone synthase
MEHTALVIGFNDVLSHGELRARMREIGEQRYHHCHPFHLLMHEGGLTRRQLQAWALNRFCYQSSIPVKDAIILSRSDDAGFRLAWRKRIIDHDGDSTTNGGIERWLKLAEATGLDAAQVRRGNAVLPATRYAVHEYLRIVEKRTLLEAVASSLTEMFSRDLITLRIERLRMHYPWLAGGLDYFDARLTQAPEDADFAFNYVCEHAETRVQQELAMRALSDKCDILWAQLDALYFAYVQPGWPPRGAFTVQESSGHDYSD